MLAIMVILQPGKRPASISRNMNRGYNMSLSEKGMMQRNASWTHCALEMRVVLLLPLLPRRLVHPARILSQGVTSVFGNGRRLQSNRMPHARLAIS